MRSPLGALIFAKPMNLPLIQNLRELALDSGLPGVLGLSFIDSAGLPTGGGPDFAVVILSGLQSQFLQVALFVVAATLGSTVGCTALYFFGHKAGELALRRFDITHRDRVKDQIDRNGFGAIFIAAMGPPPFPTKLFVISAGVFRMPLMTLVTSMMVGRALRYSIAAYLGVMLGEQAIVFVHDHAAHALVAVLLLAALLGLVQLIRKR